MNLRIHVEQKERELAKADDKVNMDDKVNTDDKVKAAKDFELFTNEQRDKLSVVSQADAARRAAKHRRIEVIDLSGED